jgi:hypothetical protein
MGGYLLSQECEVVFCEGSKVRFDGFDKSVVRDLILRFCFGEVVCGGDPRRIFRKVVDGICRDAEESFDLTIGSMFKVEILGGKVGAIENGSYGRRNSCQVDRFIRWLCRRW